MGGKYGSDLFNLECVSPQKIQTINNVKSRLAIGVECHFD